MENINDKNVELETNTEPDTTEEVNIRQESIETEAIGESVSNEETVKEAFEETVNNRESFDKKDNTYAETQRTYYAETQGNFSYGTSNADTSSAGNTVSVKTSNSKATASLVLGIIALVSNCLCCCLPVSLILAIVSLVMSGTSKKRSPNGKLNGAAIAGLVCSIVAIVFYFIILLSTFISIVESFSDPVFQAELNDILAEYGYELVF